MKTGWRVLLRLTIGLYKKDKALLLEIISYFGVGKVYGQAPQSLQLKVESMNELEAVLKHFQKFPLLTKKREDLKLLIMIVEKMRRKEHLTPGGLRKIVAIKAAMNLGLSDKLTIAFPSVVPVERPKVAELPQKIEPEWFAGFTDAEGCFYVLLTESYSHSLGQRVILVFSIVQHVRDENLIKSFIEFFNCGGVYKNRETLHYCVSKFDDILKKIIPFFKKYQIHGLKALDFADFCQIAEMMKKR